MIKMLFDLDLLKQYYAQTIALLETVEKLLLKETNQEVAEQMKELCKTIKSRADFVLLCCSEYEKTVQKADLYIRSVKL